MKKKLLLAIWPYKFTKYTNKAMEFDLLEKKFNIKVIVTDLSSIINKDFNKTFKLKKSSRAKSFNTIKSWSFYFDKLKKKYNIFLYNWTDVSSFKSLIITNIIKKSNLPTIMFQSLQVYHPNGLAHTKLYDLLSIKAKILKAFRNFGLVLYYLKWKFFELFSSFHKFQKLFIFTAGKTKQLKKISGVQQKISVKVHSLDFSNFLIQNKEKKKRKNIAFLDECGPYRQDDGIFTGDYYNYNAQKWYYDLNKFFDILEKKFSTKVIVIPHPKVKGLANPFFGPKSKRTVDHSLNAAQKIIPNSKFMIAHSSITTAISYAIASYTPILFAYNDQNINDFKKMQDFREVSNFTGSQLKNISNFKTNSLKNFIVDKKKYDIYKYTYLTSKTVQYNSNHEIIGNLINNYYKKN